MAHVHVCLVSGQPVPNLTTVVQFKPDVVHLLVTQDMEDRARWLAEAARARGASVEQSAVGAYDMESVSAACKAVQESHGSDALSLNITGGTKISTLGAFQSFYTTNWPIYYVNTRDGKIMQINPSGDKAEMPIRASIPIREYLAVHGFKMKKFQHDLEGPEARRELTQLFVNAAVGKARAIRELNGRLPDPFAVGSQYNPKVAIPEQDGVRRILEKARDLGMATFEDGDRFALVPSPDDAFYLKGGWLEEYVFLAACSLDGCEVLRNVRGQWVTRRKPPRNEFDTLIGRGNQVFYISCKTSFPGRSDHTGTFREYVYELDALGDDLVGLFGRKMLASAIEITDDAMRDRAQRHGVELVDGQGLKGLDTRLRTWIGADRQGL